MEQKWSKDDIIAYQTSQQSESLNSIESSKVCMELIREFNKKAEDTMTLSSNGAQRDNKKKLPFSWVPYEVIEAITAVLFKASKVGGGQYDKHNWKKGAEHSVPMDCLLRHAFKRAGGKMNDDCPEDCPGFGQDSCQKHSRLPHSWHMLVNAAFLVYYEANYPDLNDMKKENG